LMRQKSADFRLIRKVVAEELFFTLIEARRAAGN